MKETEPTPTEPEDIPAVIEEAEPELAGNEQIEESTPRIVSSAEVCSGFERLVLC